MKILVTGALGRLGRKLVSHLERNQYDVYSTDLSINELGIFKYIPLDLTISHELIDLLITLRPDIIINTAAITNVDLCEKETDLVKLVNIQAPEILSRYCFKNHCKLIQISTDYVFDGLTGPYSENDKSNPINFYGSSKLAAEEAVLSNPINVVVRTCVLYGYEPFVAPDFLTWLLSKLRNKERVKIVTDQFSTPTDTNDLARGILQILKNDACGLFHIAGDEYLCRYEFARLFASKADLNFELITPITTEELNQLANRPRKGGLRSLRSQQILEFQPNTLTENIQFYLEQERSTVD